MAEGLLAESHDSVLAIIPVVDTVDVEHPPTVVPVQTPEAPAAEPDEEPRLREDQAVDVLRHLGQERLILLEEDAGVGIRRLEFGPARLVGQVGTQRAAAVLHLFCLEENKATRVDLAAWDMHRLTWLCPVGIDRGSITVDHEGDGSSSGHEGLAKSGHGHDGGNGQSESLHFETLGWLWKML